MHRLCIVPRSSIAILFGQSHAVRHSTGAIALHDVNATLRLRQQNLATQGRRMLRSSGLRARTRTIEMPCGLIEAYQGGRLRSAPWDVISTRGQGDLGGPAISVQDGAR
jgi:hypothetical protein